MENVQTRPQVNTRIPEDKQEAHFFDEAVKQASSIADKERIKEQYQQVG
jgi:hypothetical protein